MKHLHRNWKLVLWTLAVAGLGCLGAAQRSAHAQNSLAGWADREYKELPSKSVSFPQLPKVLREGAFASAAEQQKFADYYNQQLFPLVTHKDNRQSQNDVIVKLRSNLKSNEKATSTQVLETLTDLTLTYMKGIANDAQYHPAARVNAMLAIGEFNSPQAAQLLLDTVMDKKQVFAVRVAAMTGLLRMAGPSGKAVLSDPQIAPAVLVDMVAFVKSRATKSDGIYWMRGQAADVLADWGKTGPKGEVPLALRSMLNDKDLPVPLRSKAARALGKLNYDGNPPAAGEYLTALAGLARDALSSDQPANRGRVELVARDVADGCKPFAASTLPSDQKSLLDGLQRTLQALNREMASAPEDVRKPMDKAKEALDKLLTNQG
jgi:hypothetical protein